MKQLNATLLGLVTLVPIQYFVFLIVGAPARAFHNSTKTVKARFIGTRLDFAEMDRGEAMSSGWWEAGMAGEPVELTGLLSSLFLTVLETALG